MARKFFALGLVGGCCLVAALWLSSLTSEWSGPGAGAPTANHISASELPAVHAAALLSSTSRPTADSLAVPARRGSYDR